MYFHRSQWLGRMAMDLTRRGLIGAGGLVAGASLLGGRGIAAPTGPLTVKIALQSERIVMGAQINGHAPELFMLDTGAFSNLIKEKIATQYRLSSVGRLPTRGVGGKSYSEFYSTKSVLVGNVFRQSGMLFGGTNMPLGDKIAGIFSASFVTAYDTDLDFVKGELRIYPGGRAERAGLLQLNSRIKPQATGADMIFADVSLGSFSAELLLDTGAPVDIVLNAAATKASGLWSDSQPYMPWVVGGTGSNQVPGRLVRVPKMRIGRLVFEHPIVTLLEPGNSSAYFGAKGLLGLKALSRLHLSTDVKNKSLWVAPNYANEPPSSYPASGVWVVEVSGGLKVIDVGNGSPASKAGLKVGDLVVGRPVAYFEDMIFGQKVSLDFDRGGKRMHVDYTLEDYL
jgi:Aspartyl protease